MENKMRKKLILLLGIILTAVIFTAGPAVADRDEPEFIRLLSGGAELKPLYREDRVFQQSGEIVQGWWVQSGGQHTGKLTLNQYLLNNGDRYYFIRYIPEAAVQEPLTLSIPVALKQFQYRYPTYPDLAKTVEVWYHGGVENNTRISGPFQGWPGCSLPSAPVYIDGDGVYCFLSYGNVFELQDKGVKKELYAFSRPVEVGEEEIRLSFPRMKNTVVEQWGIISREPLVQWGDQAVVQELCIADFYRIRKWGQEGQYEITPNTYYPSSRESYWRNPAHHIGDRFLGARGSRFLEDYALVALYTAAKTQNAKGYWISTPRSDWLYRDYKIDSTFYDTRFNTDTALFLLKGYKKYGDPVFLGAARSYAGFFLDYAPAHRFATKSGGWLVWDYGNEKNTEASTHVSLNHLLAEMNFLYEMYIVTRDIRYYDTAQKLKTAVKDTCKGWRNQISGDLWYAYLKDGSFGLADYPLVTLNDLKYSQKLFLEVDGAEDGVLGYLISVKESYLKK
jgi:hypothetical protein